MPDIQNLKYDISGLTTLKDEGIKEIGSRLEDLGNLIKIELKPGDLTSMTERGFYWLVGGLKSQKNICEIHLDLSNWSKLSSIGLSDNFSILFEGLPYVQKMIINLSLIPTMDNKTLTACFKNLKKMNSLQNLSIKVAKCVALTNQAIIDVGTSLAAMPSLAYLACDFSGLPQTDDKMVKGFALALKKAKKLTNLALNLSSNLNLTKNSIEKLLEACNGIKSLVYLEADFSKCELIRTNCVKLTDYLIYM